MKRPAEELSKASKRAQVVAATALLRAEKDSLTIVRKAIKDLTEQIAGRLAALNPADSARIRAELHKSSKDLGKALTASLVESKALTARASNAVAIKTFSAIGDELSAHWVPFAPGSFDLPPLGGVDLFSADLAADALANAWLRTADTKLSQGTAPGRLAQESTRALGPSVDRTVITEGARAFNDELQDRAKYVSARLEGSPAQALLFKRWDALLDRRTCHICSNLDNEVVPMSEVVFRSGYIPGRVHPRCRCISIPCLHQYDLNVAKIVSRDVFGPGVGRSASGRADNWEASGHHLAMHRPADKSALSTDENARWLKKYTKALKDEDYKRRLIREEVRRHETSKATGQEVASPKAPRVHRSNDMARDRRTHREVFEESLGRKIGASSGHVNYGIIVGGSR